MIHCCFGLWSGRGSVTYGMVWWYHDFLLFPRRGSNEVLSCTYFIIVKLSTIAPLRNRTYYYSKLKLLPSIKLPRVPDDTFKLLAALNTSPKVRRRRIFLKNHLFFDTSFSLNRNITSFCATVGIGFCSCPTP